MKLCRSNRRSFSLVCFCICLVMGGLPACGQEDAAANAKPSSVDRPPSDKPSAGNPQLAAKSIQLDELPKPPAEIADLIDKGAVTFFTGRIPWQEMSEARDRTGLSGTGYRLAAETKAEFQYDYNSRTRWRLRRDGDKTIVLVTVRFSSAELKVVHRIWFRRPPAADHFWKDSVVQHEFDHVRLTTDPMLAKLFAKKLAALSRFRHELSEGENVDEELINRLVQQRVKEAFDAINELVNIRYKELDRVTRHGLEPVPAESELEQWLAGDA